jgi:hypothetical protein
MRAALASPMCASIGPWLARLPSGRFPSCVELNALSASVRFVEPVPLEEAYESFIRRTGSVPTRADNWHDLFNALAWLAFPRTKAVLNRRHCEEIARRAGEPGPRGTARDVLTLFDEGGVIVVSTDPSLLELLRQFKWKTLFWERRDEVLRRMRFFVFGHAILEKALEPYKGVTAKALLLEVPSALLQQSFDAQLAEADRLAAEWFSRDDALRSTRSLSPLPVLGVPGWADNGSPAFYDDAAVFRPGYGKAGTVASMP